MHTLLRKKKTTGRLFRHAYRSVLSKITPINQCTVSIDSQRLAITRENTSSNRLITRIDDIAGLSNFDVSFDVFIDSAYSNYTNPFLLYRTTNWAGAGLGYGYCLYFMQNQVRINAATNSGSSLPDYDHIGSVGYVIGWNSVRLKVIGNSHKVWINGQLTIDTTQSRHLFGKFGFGVYVGDSSNPASYFFRNLSINKIK